MEGEDFGLGGSEAEALMPYLETMKKYSMLYGVLVDPRDISTAVDLLQQIIYKRRWCHALEVLQLISTSCTYDPDSFSLVPVNCEVKDMVLDDVKPLRDGTRAWRITIITDCPVANGVVEKKWVYLISFFERLNKFLVEPWYLDEEAAKPTISSAEEEYEEEEEELVEEYA